MPLAPGSGRDTISQNIREMIAAGHPQRQAVAASLGNADKFAHRSMGGLMPWSQGPSAHVGPGFGAPHMGGLPRLGATRSSIPRAPMGLAMGHAPRGLQHLDIGGIPLSQADPWWTRSEARGMDYHPGGLINSDVPGRTDRLPLAVAADSHVMPADVVSGLGQGSTLAGARILDAALQVGPFGTPMDHFRGGQGAPRPEPVHYAPLPAPMHFPAMRSTGNEQFAAGGAPDDSEDHARILAAGGEYIVPAHAVLALGIRSLSPQERAKLAPGGDLGDSITRERVKRAAFRKGHDKLDELIDRVRKHTIKFLKTAPPPVK